MNQNDLRRMSGWERSKRNAWLNLMKIGLCVVQAALFLVVWFQFYKQAMYHPYYYWGNWAMGGVFLALYLLLAQLYGGFQLTTARPAELVYSLTISSIFTDFVMYCVTCLLSYRLVNPVPLLLRWGAGLLVSIVWAKLGVILNDRLFPPRRTYIIYDNEDAYEAMAAIRRISWKFSVIGSVDIEAGQEAVYAALRDAEAVLLCGLRSSERNTLLKYCIEHDIQTYIRPKIGDILISGATRLHLLNMPVLHCSRSNASFWYRISKRLMDVVISGLALILTSPILLLTALAVKSDGGPAFFRQRRLTENGREFSILKFRSMRVDAEKDGVARLASENDHRITPVGQFIRKVRLDELPQLINILKGEMSIVGPRPERPEIAEQYEEEMPEFRLRLQVKAGLTGYAQVYGKYNTSPYDKLEMDLMYISNQSIVQDLKLMFATVKVLFMPESTEGVAAGSVTAADRACQEESRV